MKFELVFKSVIITGLMLCGVGMLLHCTLNVPDGFHIVERVFAGALGVVFFCFASCISYLVKTTKF